MLPNIVERFRRDRCLLEPVIGTRLDPIARIEWGWGDRHRGGRTVARVTLQSGRHLGYKPRSLRPELLWSKLVAAVNDQTDLGLAAPVVVDCGSYGWMEWIPPEPAPVRLSQRCLERIGVILALLDILQVRDAHRDNLLFARDQLILVDAETVFHPRLPGFEATPSILLTGALPWPPGRGPKAPLTDLVRPSESWSGVARGYRRGSTLLERNADRWRLLKGPIGAFRQARTRVILRPTRAYAKALKAGGRQLRPLPEPVPTIVAARILAAENEALGSGDIPVFTADVTGSDLRVGRRLIAKGFFARSGWTEVAARCRGLGTTDRSEALTLARDAIRLDHTGRPRSR